MNTLQELQAMIAGACAAYPDPKLRRKAMKACQWRLVDADGRAVQPLVSIADLMAKPRLGLRETGMVFDGRDNEEHKLRTYQALLGVPLQFDILPQITCAA